MTDGRAAKALELSETPRRGAGSLSREGILYHEGNENDQRHRSNECREGSKEVEQVKKLGYESVQREAVQLNPSKCPLRIRSPIGDGALRCLGVSDTVADLFALD